MSTKIRLDIQHRLHGRFNLDTKNLEKKFLKLKPVWKRQEKKILNGLKKVTGLDFAMNYIDVFLVDRESVKNSISHPLILRVNKSMERNLCIFIHELIHNLMWDNIQKDNWSIKIQKLYPNESKKTAIHIAVHAILEMVYTDILKEPNEIVKDIQESHKFPDYRKAWGIVKQEGYKNIIKKLKSSK